LSKLGPEAHGADYLSRRATSSARIGALFELAEYGAFATELQAELQRVRAVDNVAAVLQLALNETLLDELFDRRDQVVTRLEQQRKQLPPVDFSVFHALHMISVCRAGGLSGHGRWAVALLEQDWPRFQRSPLRTAANLAQHARYTRLHLLITQHILTSPSVADVPAAIRGEIRALSANDPRSAVSMLHESARLALAAGDRDQAVQLLRRAETYDGPGAHRDRVRYGLGVVMGGQEGAALCAESERALRDRGMVQLSGCLRADLPELFGGEWR
jgi:hypothetical protein